VTRFLVDQLTCAVCGMPIDLGWARRTGRATHIPCGELDQLDGDQVGEDVALAEQMLPAGAEDLPPDQNATTRAVIAHARASTTAQPPAAPSRPQHAAALSAPTPPPWRVLTSLEDLVDDVDPEAELEWQRDALCAQIDPEMFFPEKGGSTAEAKAVCARCDVRQQCLDYALDNGERFGIWGGLSERQRRRHRPDAAGDEQDNPDDEDEPIDDDEPETLRELCARGGLLASADIPLTTAQTYAAKGLFIEPAGTGSYGARAYRPSQVAEWLDTRRTRARQEAS
jgi:WhiB family redox-sensing transcriptional regulator